MKEWEGKGRKGGWGVWGAWGSGGGSGGGWGRGRMRRGEVEYGEEADVPENFIP